MSITFSNRSKEAFALALDLHIGEVRATERIQLRPFSTLDDLTRISGIEALRLNDIKNQGIDCIS